MAQTLSDKNAYLVTKREGSKQAYSRNDNGKVSELLIHIGKALAHFFAPRINLYCIINRGSVWA